MLGQLTKLLDRTFAVGFFLPFALFAGVSAFLVEKFEPIVGLKPWSALREGLLEGVGVTVVFCWLGALWLMAANRQIVRFKEGYGWLRRSWNPLRWWRSWRLLKLQPTPGPDSWWYRSWNPLLRWQRRRFRRLQAKLDRFKSILDDEAWEGIPLAAEVRARYVAACQEQAIYFPKDEGHLLPRSFGNTLRSFEVYPWIMYQFDAVAGWGHLLAVVPGDYRSFLEGAKSQVDFLLNLWFLSYLLIFQYLVMIWVTGRIEIWWFPLVAAGSAFSASYWARQAAVQWGQLVKASFDLYLPDLRRKLGFAEPCSREEERAQWLAFSRAVTYRKPQSLPAINLSGAPTDSTRGDGATPEPTTPDGGWAHDIPDTVSSGRPEARGLVGVGIPPSSRPR